MQERDELLKRFKKGYEMYGNELALIATDLTVNKQLLPKETMDKLLDGGGRHCRTAFGFPVRDDCGKLTDYKIIRGGGWDEAEQAYNYWSDLAKKGGAWVLSNGIFRVTPACRPELLWCIFVHGTLSGDTAEQQDNSLKYCAFADSVLALCEYKENEAHRDDKEPESISDRPNADEAPALKKSKRSTVKGETEDKLIAALTMHHKYDDSSVLNYEPIGVNELGRKAKVASSTASVFFNKKFSGHGKYQQYCINSKIGTSLKAMNEGFSPDELFGSKPPGEGDREEE